MIGKKMEAALNGQINAEIFSAYLYLSMASYMESQNLSGFANWMRVQWQEELFHASKMYDYVHERCQNRQQGGGLSVSPWSRYGRPRGSTRRA